MESSLHIIIKMNKFVNHQWNALQRKSAAFLKFENIGIISGGVYLRWNMQAPLSCKGQAARL
jgi:hypothetical protein